LEIGVVKQTEIRDEMQGAYLDYAMSVITSRALPDIRDGLKPVQRRILYAMNEMGLRHNQPYKKSARIVGDTLGRYHPHGDAPVYEALVRMAQDFTMRYPLVDGQGNFGSIDNDPPAAMRYTEARLTELAEELLLDLDKDTVDFRPNFDETLKEPTVLPGKVPNLLLNGTAGIAVGMATLIPPHNLGEIVDATDYLIDRWNEIDDIEPDDLMQFVKGPDFPTGGIILGTDGIKEAYATGKGRIVVRAKIHTEQAAGGKARIVVTEIPYQVNKSALIERIAELVRDRRVEEIGDLRDESDRQGMSIIVELKRGVEPTPVINQLLKHTALQTAFSVNMLALVDGEPRVLSLKRTLQLYVQHRQAVITRRTEFELERAKLRAHILEGLKIALDYLDEVIRTIRQSPDADVARERLMKRFKLTEIQATAILDMQLRRLAALERKKIEEELAEVHKRIKQLEDLLRSPKKILTLVKEELGDLKERFGDARRTFIAATSETEFEAESTTEEAEAIVTLTREGYIRRAPLSQYRRTRSDAVKGVQSREDDPVEHYFVANTLDNLVLLTSGGRALPLRMSQVPDVARNPTGISLKNQLESGERFVAALPLNGAQFVTMATPAGKIKRTEAAEFANLPTGGSRAINLAEGDTLSWARPTSGAGELLLVTAQGQALRLKEDDVPVQGRAAAGVWAIRLAQDDRVVAMELVKEKGELTIASAKGFAKHTPLKEFPTRGRHTGGVTALAVDKTGPVAAARVVDLQDDVILVTRNGVVLRIRADKLQKGNRSARGKRAIDLKGEDTVVALTSVAAKVEEEPLAPEESDGQKEAPPPATPDSVEHEAKAPRRAQGAVSKRDVTVAEGSKVTGRPRNRQRARVKSSAPNPTTPVERATSSTSRSKAAEEKQMEIPFASFKPLPKRK
jgi:DNA gyrase subunit A